MSALALSSSVLCGLLPALVPVAAAQTYVGSTEQPLAFGDAATAGRVSLAANAEFVGMAASADSKGYWLAGADGGIFAYGDAGFFGSAGALALNEPVVGIASTPDGKGYWLVASDGGVFAFGDAGFYGSAATAPVSDYTGMASAAGGRGYWLTNATGQVVAFGDATNFGSTPNNPRGSIIVGIAGTPDSQGYWLVGTDGGVFAFGDAPFEGSTGGELLFSSVVGMASTHDGRGYWLLTSTPLPPPGIPILGRPLIPDSEGLGLVAPRNIFFGGDPTGAVGDIQWGSWGGAQAVGTGVAEYVAPGQFVYQGTRQPAVIVAYDLGTCSGVSMYQMVSWYFPQFGQSFTPSDSPDFC